MNKKYLAAFIVEYLKKNTGYRGENGEIKTATVGEIWDAVKADTGVERLQTIRETLSDLISEEGKTGIGERAFGIKICVLLGKRKERRMRFYADVKGTLIAPAEALILKTAVEASFLDYDAKKKLLEKVDRFTHKRDEYGDDSLSVLKRALSNRTCIAFRYMGYAEDRKLSELREGVDCFEPHHLASHRGALVLIGRRPKGNSLQRYRVDRMEDVRLLKESTKACTKDIEAYLSSHPFLSDGAEARVMLCVRNEVYDEVIDEFGAVAHVTERTDEHSTFSMHVGVRDIYLFALMHADEVEVRAPQSLRKSLLATADEMKMTYLCTEEDCYLAMLERARISRCAELILGGIDLSERTEYKEIRPEHTLTRAVFQGNKLTDISFLRENSAYHGLEELLIHANEIADISPLTALRWLRRLELHHTKVADILPLADSKIEVLRLMDCPIGDYTPLRKMKYLRSLAVSLGIPESVVAALKKKGVEVTVIAPPTPEKPSVIDRLYPRLYNTVDRMTPADGE